MTREQLQVVKQELDRTYEALMRVIDSGDSMIWITGNKDTATLRRRSMDLTRALAAMRKSPYQTERENTPE